MPLSIEPVHATIGEFQRTYIYMMFIENIPDVIRTALSSIGLSVDDLTTNIDLYNTKAIFPDRKTSKINIKWGGEFINIPGVDESTRETDFEFFDDEAQKMYRFFSLLKDITGNEKNQAGVVGVADKFDIGIAKVSVDKQTVTMYRRLKNTRVYGLSTTEVSKDGSDVSKVTVSIAWDRNINDKGKIGLKLEESELLEDWSKD